jgi:uncharacterized protein (TIGR03086 family)
MSENLRRFTRAVYNMDAVVQRVPADAWDNASPCEGWTARDVVSHQVGVLDGAANIAAGTGNLALPQMPEDRSDPVGLWNQSRDNVLTALDHKGALQLEGKYWFGPMTVDAFISVVQWDPLAHAWDLAVAAGIQHVPDQQLAEQSLAVITPMADMLRKWQVIGAPVEVPDDADPMSRLLGLIGRDPTR